MFMEQGIFLANFSGKPRTSWIKSGAF